MKGYNVRIKKQNTANMRLAGKKIVMIVLILSLSFTTISWQNFLNIFAAVATYGRTEDGAWAYKVLSTSSRTVSIRPSNLEAQKNTKVEIPASIDIQGESYTVTEIAPSAYVMCVCTDCLKNNKMSLGDAWEDELLIYEAAEIEIEISEVVIPSVVTVIGDGAFEDVYLDKITFEENSHLTTIGEYAFSGCTFKNIEIPASVTTIGGSAFYYSDIQTVTFEEGAKLTEIAAYTFEESKLRTITLPESITRISEGAFWACRLSTITIPASVTTIGYYAFEANTRLKEVKFAEDGVLDRIRIGAFLECDLTEVTIPASVNTIGKCAFANNSNLKTVTFLTDSKNNNLNANAFVRVPGFNYEEDDIDEMSYEKNTSVTQVNVKNYDVYKWVANSGMFGDSTKVYSESTRVFLEKQRDADVQGDVAMKENMQATIHLDDYVSKEEGYHFAGSKFDYSDTLNMDKTNTGDIEVTDFISYGYPYVVIKANQEANEYEIAYNTYEGDASMENTKCRYDEPITISSNIPTRIGYEFVGWCKNSSGEGEVYQPGDVVNENFTDKDGEVVTLYAIWKEITKKVTISFSTPENKSADYGFEIIITRNGETIQQHDVGADQVGDKQLVIYGAKIGETYTIKCTNYEKENGKKKYFQTTTKEVTIE